MASGLSRSSQVMTTSVRTIATTDNAMPASHTTTPSSRVHPFGRLDPRRFHGAWIFLCESIAAGALVGGRYGVESAMLVGTACAGAFLVFAAIATGVSGKLRQLLLGGFLVVVSPVCALLLRADARFIHIAGVATLTAITTVLLAQRHGFLSPIVLATGVAALTLPRTDDGSGRRRQPGSRHAALRDPVGTVLLAITTSGIARGKQSVMERGATTQAWIT